MGAWNIMETSLGTTSKKNGLSSKPLAIWTKIKLDLCFKSYTVTHAYWIKDECES